MKISGKTNPLPIDTSVNVGGGGLRATAGKDLTPQRPHSPAGKVSQFDGRGREYNPGGGKYTPPTRSKNNTDANSINEKNVEDKTSQATKESETTATQEENKYKFAVNTNYGGGVTRSQIGRDGGKVPQSDSSIYKGK